MDALPIWLAFLLTVAAVAGAIELGYRIGNRADRRTMGEKEAPVSTIAGSILALLAFVMAFSFSLASNRFDQRKALVRTEAAAIQTTWLRADLLPEPWQSASRTLLARYLHQRLDAILNYDRATISEAIDEAEAIQGELWSLALAALDSGMDIDQSNFYLEALGQVITIHAERVVVTLQLRIPVLIWWVQGVLLVLGMMSVGYQMAISDSRRSWVTPVLAVAFAVVVTMITLLDRPHTRLLPVSHDALLNVQQAMQTYLADTDSGAGTGTGPDAGSGAAPEVGTPPTPTPP